MNSKKDFYRLFLDDIGQLWTNSGFLIKANVPEGAEITTPKGTVLEPGDRIPLVGKTWEEVVQYIEEKGKDKGWKIKETGTGKDKQPRPPQPPKQKITEDKYVTSVTEHMEKVKGNIKTLRGLWEHALAVEDYLKKETRFAESAQKFLSMLMPEFERYAMELVATNISEGNNPSATPTITPTRDAPPIETEPLKIDPSVPTELLEESNTFFKNIISSIPERLSRIAQAFFLKELIKKEGKSDVDTEESDSDTGSEEQSLEETITESDKIYKEILEETGNEVLARALAYDYMAASSDGRGYIRSMVFDSKFPITRFDPGHVESLIDEIHLLAKNNNNDVSRSKIEEIVLSIRQDKGKGQFGDVLFVRNEETGKVQVNPKIKANLGNSKNFSQIKTQLMRAIYGEEGYAKFSEQLNKAGALFDIKALGAKLFKLDIKTIQGIFKSSPEKEAVVVGKLQEITIDRKFDVTGLEEKYSIEEALSIEDDSLRKLVLTEIEKTLQKETNISESDLNSEPTGGSDSDSEKTKIIKSVLLGLKKNNYEKFPPQTSLSQEELKNFRSLTKVVELNITRLSVNVDSVAPGYSTAEYRQAISSFSDKYKDYFSDNTELFSVASIVVYSLGYDSDTGQFHPASIGRVKQLMDQTSRKKLDEIEKNNPDEAIAFIAKYYHDNKENIDFSSSQSSLARISCLSSPIAKMFNLVENSSMFDFIYSKVNSYFSSSSISIGLEIFNFANSFMLERPDTPKKGEKVSKDKKLSKIRVHSEERSRMVYSILSKLSTKENLEVLSEYFYETTRPPGQKDKNQGNFTESLTNIAILTSIAGSDATFSYVKHEQPDMFHELRAISTDGKIFSIFKTDEDFGFGDGCLVAFDENGIAKDMVPIEYKSQTDTTPIIAHVAELKPFTKLARFIIRKNKELGYTSGISYHNVCQFTLKNSGQSVQMVNLDQGLVASESVGKTTGPEMEVIDAKKLTFRDVGTSQKGNTDATYAPQDLRGDSNV